MALDAKALPPRYEEWLNHLFHHDATSGVPEWQTDSLNLSAEELVTLWITTMERCQFDLIRFSDAQIGSGLWFLLSNAHSDYTMMILTTDQQVAVYESIALLYRGIFQQRCVETLGHLSEHGTELNSICYMLWDVSPLGWPPENCPPAIVEALFEVLKGALEIPHRACIESALHGLGELYCRYPEMVEQTIGDFLARTTLDPALTSYAIDARSGEVQ